MKKRYTYNRLSGTDIVVNEACKGVVEKLNFTCASTQARPFLNILLNSGFDRTLNSWTLRGQDVLTPSIDTSVYLTAPASFKAVLGSGGYFLYKQTITMINGHRYCLQGNTRYDNAVMNS